MVGCAGAKGSGRRATMDRMLCATASSDARRSAPPRASRACAASAASAPPLLSSDAMPACDSGNSGAQTGGSLLFAVPLNRCHCCNAIAGHVRRRYGNTCHGN